MVVKIKLPNKVIHIILPDNIALVSGGQKKIFGGNDISCIFAVLFIGDKKNNVPIKKNVCKNLNRLVRQI
jgi:hypothetical protein